MRCDAAAARRLVPAQEFAQLGPPGKIDPAETAVLVALVSGGSVPHAVKAADDPGREMVARHIGKNDQRAAGLSRDRVRAQSDAESDGGNHQRTFHDILPEPPRVILAWWRVAGWL